MWFKVKFKELLLGEIQANHSFSRTSYLILLQASGLGMREGKTCETEVRMQEVDEETMERYSTFWKSQSLYYFRDLHGVVKKNQDFLLQMDLV